MCDNQTQETCDGQNIGAALAKSGQFPSKWLNKAGDGLIDPYGSPFPSITPYTVRVNGSQIMVLSLKIHNKDQCQKLFTYALRIQTPPMALQNVDIVNIIVASCERLSKISEDTVALSLPI